MATLRRTRTTLYVFLSLMILAIYVNFEMVAPFLLSVVMGGILAILSFPLYRRLTSRRVGPKTSASIVTVAIILGVITPLSLIGWAAIHQGIAIGEQVSSQEAFSVNRILDRVSKIPLVRNAVGNSAQVEAQAKQQVQKIGAAGSRILLAILAAIPNIGLQVALALIACFFFMVDGRRFLRYLDDKIPLDRDVRRKIYGSFQDTAISVIWATLAAGAVQAAIMGAAFWAFGIPGAFLAAGATFIFAWIPILGSTPVWIAGIVYFMARDSAGMAAAMFGIGMICGVSDNFVRPLVLKGRGDMHPLVSLVAIFGGIELFGLFGVFYGPILAAVLLALLQVWPSVAKRFGLIPEEAAPAILTPAEAAVQPGLVVDLTDSTAGGASGSSSGGSA